MLILKSQLMGRCMSRRPKWPSEDIDIHNFGVFQSPGMKTRAKVAAEQMSLRATTILRSLSSLKRIQGEVQHSNRRGRKQDESRLGVRRGGGYMAKKVSQKHGAAYGPVLKLEKELRGRTIVMHLRLDAGHLQSKSIPAQVGSCTGGETCRADEARAELDAAAPAAAQGMKAGVPFGTPAAAAPCSQGIDASGIPGPSNSAGCDTGGKRPRGEEYRSQGVGNWVSC